MERGTRQDMQGVGASLAGSGGRQQGQQVRLGAGGGSCAGHERGGGSGSMQRLLPKLGMRPSRCQGGHGLHPEPGFAWCCVPGLHVIPRVVVTQRLGAHTQNQLCASPGGRRPW